MPPWLPAPGPFPLTNERRLNDQEIETIQKWVAAGAPQGNATAPKLPAFEAGWQLGKPDLVVTAAKSFRLTASGSDVYWNFVLPVPIDRTRWLRAIEIRPSDKRVVHHANILLDRGRTARASESEPGAGFPGMELRVESEAFDPDSHFLFWKAGSRAIEQPKGMSLRIDKGNDLLLNMHLQPSGKPELIQPSVGLYFTDAPATLHPMLLELENDAALKIPAGDANFVVTELFELPLDVDLLAIYPHAHYLGKHLRALAKFPDGTQKSLLEIPNWDLNWQGVFSYARPVLLPKGTVVSMRYQYDNSAGNSRNPNNPPAEVKGGNRAQDEMAHLWLQVLPRPGQTTDDPRLVLQEAFSRHEVERDPSVFEAQYNLAAMLLRRGQVREAIEHYRVAAELRPRDPVVNNALGSAEMALGDLRNAVSRFQSALAGRPDYFDAHYNLGLALGSLGEFEAAEEELRKAAQLQPKDANAHANLGVALAQLGKIKDARAELELALKLDPGNRLVRENLSQLESGSDKR
jgi:Flp pilus assembly protein TadD